MLPSYSYSYKLLTGTKFSDEYSEKLSGLAAGCENVSIIPWGNRISDVMTDFDMLITPGSSMVMEALSLNIPCITYEFAYNHHETVIMLEREGMAASFGKLPCADGTGMMKKIFDEELLYETRLKRSAVYSPSFDGRGLERVVRIILNEE